MIDRFDQGNAAADGCCDLEYDKAWLAGYERGWRAFQGSGQFCSKNPYAAGAAEHDGWESGFRKGKPAVFTPY